MSETIRPILISMVALLLFVVSASAAMPLVDKVLVLKAERKLLLLKNGASYREYAISLGDAPRGHKQCEGDERTPEGRYTIDYRNPRSRYHLSLHISYPNGVDRENARKNSASPGGDIFIHGLPNGQAESPAEFADRDWTDGCIAVNNQDMEEIWTLVKTGTTIEIIP